MTCTPWATAVRGVRRAVRRWSSTVISPPGSGCSTPEMILMSVDFPLPFSPARQCSSPRRTSKSTSRNAWTPAKRLEIFFRSRNRSPMFEGEMAAPPGSGSRAARRLTLEGR